YDSDEARGLCGAITALLHGVANRTSAELAATVGPFDAYEENRLPMLRVMLKHRERVDEIAHCPRYLVDAAKQVWDEVVALGDKYGFRNAQVTVLAPTGTISFMMDCDTTGIEPDIALVKYKQLAGGGTLRIVNQTAPLGLKKLGYGDAEIKAILEYLEKEGTIEKAPGFKDEHQTVFDCAFQAPGGTRSIPWMAHVRMMAAAQPFISGAISKTVNMPNSSKPDDIAQAYLEGWRLGLKALAIYRDGSKGAQPLSTTKKSDKKAEAAAPRRERLPDTRQSVTHKFSVAGHEGYITVGLYPDGRPGELFITMAKEGSTIGGMMDCFGTAVSMSMQYGVPLAVYVEKFSHTRFEPMGQTKNPDVRFAKSIIDYIFRWLGVTFLPGYREMNNGTAAAREKPSGGASGESETEPGPTATKAGGPDAGQGAAIKKPESSNGRAGGQPYQAAAGGATATDVAEPEEIGRRELFASFQTDAPICDSCGAITVRSGNCYLCHNCGNSMGCS
ncbi:MAG: vitamin B12-dependent ribonucleotide reductase, partial [Pirellulales bacterium]|nr:vitamin B12-dependent ribonucleotide reductase [Pirellulales bacterium]